jgi:CubicO group peptidase (beta-lactamase class C family)
MRGRNIAYGLLLILSFIILSRCAVKPFLIEQPSYWPDEDWRTSTPEEQGLDSSMILAMLDEILSSNLQIHSLLIVRHGYLVTEVYFPPYQQEMKHPVFSMTKSITSAMVGKAMHEGYIESINQNVLEYFPEIALETKDPGIKELTLEHLLTMSAGYNTNTMPNFYGKDAGFDTVRHILTYNSVLWPPGSSFYYDSGLPHLLSAILQKSTGKTLQDYTSQELFEPLGITEVSWGSDPSGITTGATGLMLRPRDMAKFGYLYLHQGAWNGKQLLPVEWVQTSTSKRIETEGLMNAAEDDGYGYLWWIDSFGGYSAHGFGGQYVFVLPDLDMVVVFTAGLPDSLFPIPKQLVQSYIIPAAQASEPLISNTQSFQSLTNRIQLIEQGERSNVILPKVALEISGKTFRVTKGKFWVPYDAFTLTFADGEIYRNETLMSANQPFVVTGSLNKVFHLNRVTYPGPPAMDLLLPLRGHWQDDVTFIEEYMQNLNTDIDLITQKYIFAGDQVTIDISSRMGLFAGQITGEMVK